MTKQPHGPPMTLGNMRHLGVQRAVQNGQQICPSKMDDKKVDSPETVLANPFEIQKSTNGRGT
jgi:hypothetical protein